MALTVSGMVSFEPGEIERIERMRLVRLGVRPDEIDDMNVFDKTDLLELSAVEMMHEHKQLAQLMANELAKILAKMRR